MGQTRWLPRWTLSERGSRLLASAVAVLVGVLVLVTGLLSTNGRNPVVSSRITVSGTVVDTQMVVDSNGQMVILPVVAFQDQEHRLHTIEDQTPVNSSGSPKIGDKVSVTYTPKHPANAEVVSKLYNWLPWVVAGVGIATLAFGLASLGALAGSWVLGRLRPPHAA
jgi:small-conductance mechanosensitive channel